MQKLKIKFHSTKLVQIIPVPDFPLFGQMVRKEIELRRKGGAFFRSKAKQRGRAKWSHATYKGWISLQQTAGEVVTAEVHSGSVSGDHWKILHAFIGWMDRHFSSKLEAIHIHYRE